MLEQNRIQSMMEDYYPDIPHGYTLKLGGETYRWNDENKSFEIVDRGMRVTLGRDQHEDKFFNVLTYVFGIDRNIKFFGNS